MLTIRNLYTSANDKTILKGVSLSVGRGEVHVIMGPNGSGKSTLAYTIMGHPTYIVQSPPKKLKTEIKLDGTSLMGLEADQRARLGLFLAFQTPVAISGVSVMKFLRQLYSAKGPVMQRRFTDIREVYTTVEKLASILKLDKNLLKRSLNDNFSGGEKKKIETLQMLFLQPKYVLVDEVDTGLDVDALQVVARAIATLKKKRSGILIITHYQRILKYIEPDRVHIMIGGTLVKSDGSQLVKKIEKEGYKAYES